MPTDKPRCQQCKSFVSRSTLLEHDPCVRCDRMAKAKIRRAKRADRALRALSAKSQSEHWSLVRLHKALSAARRRIDVGRDRWDQFVKAVFGRSTEDLVDPRQMILFSTEPTCPASPSPSHLRSA
jgi:hypothetical protein